MTTGSLERLGDFGVKMAMNYINPSVNTNNMRGHFGPCSNGQAQPKQSSLGGGRGCPNNDQVMAEHPLVVEIRNHIHILLVF